MHIEHYSSLTDMEDIGFSLCGYEDCGSDFFHRGGQVYRDSYLIHLITKGSGYYSIGDRQYHLQEGDFFTVFRTDSVCYWPEGSGWSFCWFAFRGEHSAEYLTRAGITREHPTGTLQDPMTLRRCIERMISLTEPRHQQENVLQIKAALYDALGCIYREAIQKHPMQPQTQKKIYVRQALAFIENNYQRTISTSDIARYLSLDAGYFTRIFHAEVDLPPNQYLMKYRLQQSCRMLVSTCLSGSEIAARCGWHNINYFFRLFRRTYGCTPGEYRIKNGNKQKSAITDDDCACSGNTDSDTINKNRTERERSIYENG